MEHLLQALLLGLVQGVLAVLLLPVVGRLNRNVRAGDEPPPGRFASRFEGADHGSSVHALVVPAGAAHTLVNSGDGPLRLVSIHPRPRMEQEWLGS